MSIIVVTRAARAAIIRSEAQAAQSLRMLHKHAVRTTTPSVTAYIGRMQAETNNNGGVVPHAFLYSMSSSMVVAQIKVSMQHFGENARTIVGQVMHTGTQSGTQMAQAQLQASVPKGHTYQFALAHPSAKQVQRRVQVYQLFDKYGQEAATAASDAIRQGVIAGRGPLVIARDLMAATDISLVSALNTSRTESMYAMRDATLANYRANDDVVDSWIWYATAGCCGACAAMMGTEHSLDEEMDTHPNDRCTQVPKTKSWADIFAGTGIDASDIPETTVQVPQSEAWFASLPETQQREMLGTSKYNALHAGDITLGDLVGKSRSNTWGTSMYEKSLKDLGLNAGDYQDE